VDLAPSCMKYRACFWIRDYEFDDQARDEVRTAIHYAFQRRGVEIALPTHIVRRFSAG